ncbi:helix-turn-helix domain-containing protein [Clostridium ihumii]|uniref:helix-turn-helix domain-containing protein n=1 Tax=Clostridium ihumii TaxID=1470356 RepID=UPI00058B3D75|nr:helix-turn-helix transcriptional regulator [Clostridium ihumii]
MNQEQKMETIINRIKNRRIELMLSYQDLANKTGLSKSTLQRYETGSIKNMPLDKLEILAEALNIEPYYLMGWDIKKDTTLSKNEIALLDKYNKLNDLGKSEANKRVSELTEIYKYTNNCIKSDNEITTFAAHTDEDNPEFAKYDEEIAKKFMNKLKNKDNK